MCRPVSFALFLLFILPCFFWPLYCLVPVDLRPLMTILESSNLLNCKRMNASRTAVLSPVIRRRRGRDRMVVGFTTTRAISAYHH